MKIFNICFFLIFSMIFCSCSKDDDTNGIVEQEELSITKFTVKAENEDFLGDIDQVNKTIKVLVPSDFDIKKVLIEVEYTEGAMLKPESGYAYNFTQPIDFTLTKSGFETVVYKASVGTSPDIISFDVPDYYRTGVISDSIINLSFNYGTDLSNIKPEIKVASGCQIEPASGTAVDMSNDVVYKVTNNSGDVREYIVKATVLPQEKQIRGVWVPDPTHTNVLLQYDNVKEFVDLLDELNINAIYLATWVREQTLFKSEVLKNNTNYATVEDGWLLKGSNYSSSTNDPIKDLITLAHEKDIKVFFWFEYGFMRSEGENPSENHPLLSVHPEWDGINSFGKPANYNGTDYYLNSYDPEVQNFIIDLIKESIQLYPDIDGVQGDDRLPASPRNSGYNESVKNRYKSETGKDAPDNYNDPSWVRWRLDCLNEFGKRLYDEVKAIDNTLLVSFSPNPYPWCENNLMQDWPNWIKGGYIDFLSVQCYRETTDSYRATVEEAKKYVDLNTDKNILNPGIYLRSGNDWEELFASQMLINRELGTNGEAFFFNEGLKRDVNKKVIKSFYTGKAIFPF